jgi:alpha-glucosidase
MIKAANLRRMTPSKQRTRRPYDTPPGTVHEADTLSSQRYEDVYYEHAVEQISTLQRQGTQEFLLVNAGAIHLRLEFWSDDLIRFRYSYGGEGPDFSYGRAPEARPRPTTVEVAEADSRIEFRTATLRVEVDRADGRVRIYSREHESLLHAYAAPFYCRTTLMKGLDQVRLQLEHDSKESYYGLGDKAWDTNLSGRYFENWNSDSFAYGRERDALYRSIPVYYGLREGVAYGVFLDNTYRSHFDFNSQGDGKTTIWADGGSFDYYFINGPRLDAVASRYTQLTGLPELPPLWALGYHQCRWSYYPEKRVRELANSFREKAIPCDALYLDIDYMDGYRCFTWNHDYFPDPKQMIGDLREQGFQTVVMIDPGIRVDEDYPVYREGVARDVFCRRTTGEQMVGPVWPPECVWPDYTNPRVRDWWGKLYHELYVEQGVSGFWNDMNEPAMFKVNALTFPLNVRHDYDGLTGDHAKAHNIYGMQMARATYEGLKELQPAKRPFLLARASYSGGQRHASLWTGDNIASWEHLAIANRQCLRLAISGYSLVGTDIGGFVDDPSPELLTRWLQLAVFHPLMRVHSMGNNTDGAAEAEAEEVKQAEASNRQDQEPWVHGGVHTQRNRAAIAFRYRLLPYLYTAFRRHVQTGIPVLRNLFFYDQEDPGCRTFGDQFLAGDDLLVCPIVKPGVKTMTVYLPRGDWYDYWTGKRYGGKQKIRVRAKADRLPIFARAGGIIPTMDAVQHTGELQDLDTVKLSVFLNTSGHGTFYWDAGEGYGYQSEQYSLRTFAFQRKGASIRLEQANEGQFRSNFDRYRVRLHGLDGPPSEVEVDGKLLPDAIQSAGRSSEIILPYDFTEVWIKV